jgi:hypothetical protein
MSHPAFNSSGVSASGDMLSPVREFMSSLSPIAEIRTPRTPQTPHPDLMFYNTPTPMMEIRPIQPKPDSEPNSPEPHPRPQSPPPKRPRCDEEEVNNYPITFGELSKRAQNY